MADSRDVAAYFGKERRSVLRSIPELIALMISVGTISCSSAISMISSRVAILLPAELRPSKLSSRQVGKFRV